MYRVNINGTFSGAFETAAEAMAYVDKHAKPYGLRWEILDNYNNIYAQG